jgi:hypothetical protein
VSSIKLLQPLSDWPAQVSMRENFFVQGMRGSLRYDPVNGPILTPYSVVCLLVFYFLMLISRLF